MSADLSNNSFVVVPPPARAVQLALREAAQLIRRSDRFLIVSHADPDGDAIGSSLALACILRALGKTEVVVLNADRVPYNFAFLTGANAVIDRLAPERERRDAFDVVCVLDCNRAELLGSAAAALGCAEALLVIDHHAPAWQSGCEAREHVLVNDTSAAATGELLYRLALELGVELAQPLAECLYCAVITDTGSFRYGSTTPTAHCIAAALLTCGVDTWRIASHVYESHPVERVELLGEALRTLELSPCRRLAVLRIDHELVQRAGADESLLDGIINHARAIRGVEAAAQLQEVSHGLFELTLRSRGHIDVGRLAARLGGRGSRYAGRCTVAGQASEIVAQLTEQFVAMVDGTTPADGARDTAQASETAPAGLTARVEVGT